MKSWSWVARMGAPGKAGAQDISLDEWLRRGAEYQGAAQYDKAEECFREALVRHPENAAALHMLADVLGVRGYAYQERGELDAAVECYLEALALAPAHALGQVHNNLGNAYLNLGRLEDAVSAFREAISMNRGYAEAHLNLGIAQQQLGEIEQAITLYRTALELKPDLAVANLNLGYVLEHKGDTRGAMECYRNAIAAQPDFANAHFNLGLLLLLTGDFTEAWEQYEWRLRLPEVQQHRPYADRPRWEGADLQGRAILLYTEQGLGDSLQFARYVPLVAERCGRVIVSCQPQLKTLFEGAGWAATVVDGSEPLPAFDFCCPLLSLPRIFGTTPATIPARVPYIRADAGKAARWKARVAAAGPSRLKVGLVWATEARSRVALRKSLSLGMLEPLAAIPEVIFYSLQKGPAAAERAPKGMRLVDVAAELDDFSETAALISQLDLVVTIDTAVAHLAGAMGRPVWTLTHWPPDWRWLLHRDDSPWYPTMRLFRRAVADTWDDVIGRVGDALRDFAVRAPGRAESV